ncbi:hypothetical protein [Nocardioides perillae]|uniref:Uncharacterized protein n=1 Tax=Nocardioides perillae TaxID=1119534 RepID=A0A7Y9UNR4_9ACTN|nr:hypothetical protein [Nocardioides perillae]NYG56756.1 hypothetical protein [Nocardioides perillae]
METTGPADAEERAAERVLAEGLVVDLADPPTREELALPDGVSSTVLQTEDETPAEVTVRFSDGGELVVPAYAVVVDSLGPEAPPTSLALARVDLSPAELADVLASAVAELGADEAAVAAYLDAVPRAGSREGDLIRAIPTRYDGREELVLDVVTTQAEGRIRVNYLVAWGEETAPVPGSEG